MILKDLPVIKSSEKIDSLFTALDNNVGTISIESISLPEIKGGTVEYNKDYKILGISNIEDLPIRTNGYGYVDPKEGKDGLITTPPEFSTLSLLRDEEVLVWKDGRTAWNKLSDFAWEPAKEYYYITGSEITFTPDILKGGEGRINNVNFSLGNGGNYSSATLSYEKKVDKTIGNIIVEKGISNGKGSFKISGVEVKEDIIISTISYGDE